MKVCKTTTSHETAPTPFKPCGCRAIALRQGKAKTNNLNDETTAAKLRGVGPPLLRNPHSFCRRDQFTLAYKNRNCLGMKAQRIAQHVFRASSGAG